MESLSSIDEVIVALGGPAATARLVARSPQAVTNWRAEGRMPPKLYLVMHAALAQRGKRAPASLWGMTEPAGVPS